MDSNCSFRLPMDYCVSDLTMEKVLLRGKSRTISTHFNSIQLSSRQSWIRCSLFAASAYISLIELHPSKPRYVHSNILYRTKHVSGGMFCKDATSLDSILNNRELRILLCVEFGNQWVTEVTSFVLWVMLGRLLIEEKEEDFHGGSHVLDVGTKWEGGAFALCR